MNAEDVIKIAELVYQNESLKKEIEELKESQQISNDSLEYIVQKYTKSEYNLNCRIESLKRENECLLKNFETYPDGENLKILHAVRWCLANKIEFDTVEEARSRHINFLKSGSPRWE